MTGNAEAGHRILEILYEDHFGDDDTNLQSDDIAGKIDGVDESQVKQILGNLHQADLVGRPTRTPKLTSEGIKVVLDQKEREERQNEREERKLEREERQEDRKREIRINKSVAYLTIALVLAGGFQGVARNLVYFSPKQRLIYSLVGAVAIFGVTLVFLLYVNWWDKGGET
ncbi:hypothetical protein [Haloplanus vescus]|uniref:hypothetical protein n=1 Tax=Haloplanus vescus TaxID=555874 RepID=UPI000AF5B9F6|nr:hypothetical protein [Haloplanus vescus]